jgi:hypothetical protein
MVIDDKTIIFGQAYGIKFVYNIKASSLIVLLIDRYMPENMQRRM